MPHIIYKGIADLRGIHAGFQPAKTESNGWIIRLTQAYLAANGQTIIMESTAVRSGFVQTFYALVEQKGDKLTLRIDPHTAVERNEGVKRTLTTIRDLLLAANPHLVFDKSNLPPEILGDGSPDLPLPQ